MEATTFGRYRLIELLGRGGMGEVWRAHDTVIDRIVAIKTLLPHFAQDRTFEQRFRREARAAASLDDPHVVPIYDVGEIGGRLYVAMRLINGRDLQALLDHGPLKLDRAVSITNQVASALQAAHRAELVHRDVKPSNILVTDDDFAYLIDFGIARAAGETGITSTGATIGTWSYMAPERFRSGEIEPSSDIYALACVLYQSLTGRLPFPGTTMEQVAMAHMTAPPPKPSEQDRAIPVTLDDVIAIGLAKNPNQRYRSARDLATAAQAALNQPQTQTVAAPAPKHPATGSASHVSRRRWLAPAALSIILLVVVTALARRAWEHQAASMPKASPVPSSSRTPPQTNPVTTSVQPPQPSFSPTAIDQLLLTPDQLSKILGVNVTSNPAGAGGGGLALNSSPNPHGSPTAYLWQQILQRDTWLDILGRFMHLHVEDKIDSATNKKIRTQTMLFPRFHQWEVVTRLVEAARDQGPGRRYLIQHSAGSGKTNSISWLTHRLSVLHNDANNPVFDSVVVITDRNVLDAQLGSSPFGVGCVVDFQAFCVLIPGGVAGDGLRDGGSVGRAGFERDVRGGAGPGGAVAGGLGGVRRTGWPARPGAGFPARCPVRLPGGGAVPRRRAWCMTPVKRPGGIWTSSSTRRT